VRETESGTWQVQTYYQGSSRKIGTFQTLEQATTANEIARSMLKKDKGLQLSAEECQQNIKLAKEAALTTVMTGVKRGRGLQKKAKQMRRRMTVIRDSSRDEPSENRDGGLSRHGRKRKLSKKKVDSLDIDEDMGSIDYCQPTSTKSKRKRKRAGRPRSTKSASVSAVKGYKLCSVTGCTKLVQQGGVCCRHGAKTTRRLCSYKGAGGQCTNVSKRGGLCRRHGAFDLPDCSDPFCKRVAQKGDVFCVLHTKQDRNRKRGKQENEEEQDNENEGEPIPNVLHLGSEVCPIALEEKEKEDFKYEKDNTSMECNNGNRLGEEDEEENGRTVVHDGTESQKKKPKLKPFDPSNTDNSDVDENESTPRKKSPSKVMGGIAKFTSNYWVERLHVEVEKGKCRAGVAEEPSSISSAAAPTSDGDTIGASEAPVTKHIPLNKTIATETDNMKKPKANVTDEQRVTAAIESVNSMYGVGAERQKKLELACSQVGYTRSPMANGQQAE